VTARAFFGIFANTLACSVCSRQLLSNRLFSTLRSTRSWLWDPTVRSHIGKSLMGKSSVPYKAQRKNLAPSISLLRANTSFLVAKTGFCAFGTTMRVSVTILERAIPDRLTSWEFLLIKGGSWQLETKGLSLSGRCQLVLLGTRCRPNCLLLPSNRRRWKNQWKEA